MSLQPGINPLERIRTPMAPGMRTMEVRNQHRSFPSAEELSAKMNARQRVAIPAAPGMGPGMAMTGGFDPSSLMSAPQLRQDATMNQANMVSSPYFEANEKAAEKTNPMNAVSQEPGKSFLMKYIGK